MVGADWLEKPRVRSLVPLRLFLFSGLCKYGSMSLCAVLFFLSLPMETFRCIFQSGHMVDSLGYWSGVIIVCTGFLHSGANLFSPLLGSHGAVILVYPLWLFQYSFLTFLLFLGVTDEFLLCWIFYWVFLGSTCWSFSVYAFLIGTLGGYAWVNEHFNWYWFLVWFPSWFTIWIFSWYTSSAGTLRGTVCGVSFRNISVRYLNDSLLLDKMIYKHAEQPLWAWMLVGTRAKMLTEACSQTHRHEEVWARMLTEARAQMILEALVRKFLLILRACA